MDSQTRSILHAVVRRESLSVLMYVADAFPWTTAGNSAALAQLRQLIQEEKACITALGRYLARQREPLPYLGSFPSSFTTINFISLEYLLPRLIAFEKASIADLEADLKALTDSAATAEVSKLLQVKRRNLAALEGLLKPIPQTASA
jgi:hypothetical protein